MKSSRLLSDLKTVRNLFFLLMVGFFSGVFLMFLAYLIPVNSNHIASSKQILEDEGWYPVMPYIKGFTEFGTNANAAGRLDNFTDGIMIETAAADTQGRPFHQAIDVNGYSYYWHGYVTILRPLLYFLDYGEIRVLNQLLQILLIFVLAGLLTRKKGLKGALLVLSVYVLLMPAALGMSLQYSWVFYIGVAASIILVRYENWFRANNRIYYLFIVIGMLTCFFDLLTYPLFTWGIPMILWLVLDNPQSGEKKRLMMVVGCGLCWILGYGGIWAGKWVLTEILLHKGAIAEAWNEVRYRAGMIEGTDGDTAGFIDVLKHNFAKFYNVQTLFLLIGWGIWFVVRFWKCRGSLYTGKSLSLSLVACSSFVWYLVLHNHSYVHSYFTYRTLAVSFGALLAFFIITTEEECKMDGFCWCVRAYSVPIIIGVISILIAMQFREEYMVHNGNYEPRQIVLEEGNTIIQSMYPRYKELKYLNLGLKAEGKLDGVFVVEIYQEDELIFSTRLQAKDVADSGFYYLPVHVKVDKQECIIYITFEEIEDTTAYISVTNGEFPLTEWGNILLDGSELNGQMTGAICYTRIPQGYGTLVNAMALSGILWMVYVNIYRILFRYSLLKKVKTDSCH